MGSVLDRETMGPNTKKVHNWVSWGLTAIFFIVVIAYASWRGYYSHLKSPSVTSTWTPQASVPFPSITFCPVVPIPISVLECELEKNDAAVGDCTNTMSQTSIIIESVTYNCLTFNSKGTIFSGATYDEIGIQIYMNSSLLPADDPIMGCFVMVQPAGTAPVLEWEHTFVVDVAKTTEVFLAVTQITRLSGVTELDYIAAASGSQNRDPAPTFKDTMDVDFWFNPMGGITVAQEYIPYTVDNWIGEVGGFTCLLTFLHCAVLWIFMAIYRKIKNEPVMMRTEDKF